MARTLTILKAARASIEDPAHWGKGRFSRVVNDKVCYCAVGAVADAVGQLVTEGVTVDWEITSVLETLVEQLPPSTDRRGTPPTHRVTAFNDSSTHSEVLALFDRAIAEAVCT